MLLSNIPMTWKLSHMVVPAVNNSIFSPEYSTAANRTSPKRYVDGGIGLGIVAALENSGNGIYPVCYSGTGSNGSDPVRCSRRLQFAAEIDPSEEYTCVTTRDGLTKVYYNDREFEFGKSRGRTWKEESMQISEESPAKKRNVIRGSPGFLTTCCLCKKKLHGQDIYMYKGDEGFCSKECRSVKIMDDSLEYEEHKSLTRVEVLSSPYVAGLFVI
ncbi:PREDICTED: uncharacterized protein LOC104740616 [Camelina sativa]|uniref:Uncharacterized protein LOC104740616 n=1 Tax=Camelina sativa TaxID=90675 RepID=A0ABM0VQA0_CAMSA|nr:PREDICTED: uncharacterized protein LOC104740616 [Camelina sativa]